MTFSQLRSPLLSHGPSCRDGSACTQEYFPQGITPCLERFRLPPNVTHFPRELNVPSTSCQTRGKQLC